ncbi:hypothetical protein Hanom_Chr05g00456841 [Helianthus anomalus]
MVSCNFFSPSTSISTSCFKYTKSPESIICLHHFFEWVNDIKIETGYFLSRFSIVGPRSWTALAIPLCSFL